MIEHLSREEQQGVGLLAERREESAFLPIMPLIKSVYQFVRQEKKKNRDASVQTDLGAKDLRTTTEAPLSELQNSPRFSQRESLVEDSKISR
jgi:hypothetical protein